MLNRFIILKSFVLIVLIILQSCTQPKKVRVPTSLVKMNIISPYSVDLQWQLSSSNLSHADSEGLLLTLSKKNLYFANLNGLVTSAFIADKGFWSSQVDWRREFNESITSGPVLAKKSLIIGTSKANLMLLNAKNGNILWKTELSSEVLSSTVLADDDTINNTVYTRTVDGKLYSLNIITGKINWVIDHQLPKLSLRGIAPITYYEGTIYVGWETGKVEAIDAITGESKWQTQILVPKGRTDIEKLVDLQAELVVKNGILYALGYRGKLAAINLYNGSLFWAKEVSGHQNFIVDDNALYLVDEDDVLRAYDLLNGTMRWKQANFKYRQLADLAFYEDKYLFLADGLGYFHWIDKLNGTQIARAKYKAPESFSQQAIRVLVVNSQIFMMDSQGYISVYKVKNYRVNN